ncbi:hypothetical protein H5410_053053 [Solanum commersonii]|uniref:Sphingomyelin synthase-like domain-containing protein n=1 Tax=Solanum commersonii TaxID=4109 RepID=A0A9J5X3A5_SOLCO|nr:hypothetical protein H5410_053053 [Solanum commersonii]
MSFYIGREASKLWKRICTETGIEINLLSEKWKYILGGLIFQVQIDQPFIFFVAPSEFGAWNEYSMIHIYQDVKCFTFCQYIHGFAARGVHYIHRPGPTLQDVGFFLLPELGQDKGYISETVFTTLFLSFVLWTFHPFFFKIKKIYTVLIWCRILAFLAACQFLRIITFYSTQLPGPNYHCREGSKLATLPPPNIPRGMLYGCGDLIFSSHMIFSLIFVRTYHKYGTRRFIKLCAWLAVIAQSFLIVASRKHYTVDVVVAWYTVNLVVFFVDKQLPELPDRTSAALILPLSKDSKAKEENHKLLNANSGDPAEWI